MKLTITNQFQDFLKSIGADISVLLQRAEVPNKLWQEEISLTTLEYHRLLQEFDRVMTEENIRALSQISQIQMFVPAFFAALSSPHGLGALERFARFKKIVGPIEVEVVEAETTVSVAYKFAYANMGLPTEEISSLIGYSEVNAFSRAFKKWTGMTLTEYKKEHT